MSSSPAALIFDSVDLTLTGPAGSVEILKSVSLRIESGETVALLGPSGAGKSSLLLLAGGLERTSKGRIFLADKEITQMSEDQLAAFRRDHIGIIFQDFHLIPSMTATENVALPLEFQGEDKPHDRAKEALNAVGLGHRLGHYPGQLSGGEQQRVAIARALVVKPKILLADEPTGNLDGETGGQIINLLFELAAKMGSSLLLITHDTALAKRCGRQIHMADGRLLQEEALLA